MKIFTAAQIKACDAYTIHASSITSIDLMERAAARCAEWIMENTAKDTPYIILCGSGNNGGDGLAIARMLHQNGYSIKCFLLKITDTLSHDCQLNLERLQKIDNALVQILQPGAFISDIPSNIVLIDAILGTGLNRPAEGWVKEFIEHINDTNNRKIAIDIPSGMPADNIPPAGAAILSVDHTLSFQFYKRAFLHTETGRYAGNVHILDIGLHPTFIAGTHTNYQTLEKEYIRSIYKPRSPFTHKGNYGNAIIIGGSYGMIGAAILAARSCLRAGAGKVHLLIPECGYTIAQTAIPEVMCTVKGERAISDICGWTEKDSIGIGPGLGTIDYTIEAFANFIEEVKQPIVIDADALNILGKQPELLHKIPANSILTPHPKEFERIFGKSANSMQQLELARTQAMRLNVYIILKGHYTAIVTPEGECWYNLTGNAGMATGGSGDVLTGILTGLLAQGYNSEEAALLGVYMHGFAGDIAAEKLSMEALIAGDICDNIGEAYKAIAGKQTAV